jgi:predicted dehydrogenase
VLVEKPLFHCFQETKPNEFLQTYVAYNLRFHPVIQRLKALLTEEKIISVLAYVGQYLPGWRPQRDYRQSYSAKKEQGGGVLRDLSHELDYLLWLLEGWERLAAQGGHFSPLEINSEDVIAFIMETPRCPVVNVQLNYLDRMTRRFIVVNTAEHTIEADLVRGTLTIDNSMEKFNIEKDMTYRRMHKSILEDGCETLCSFQEGVEVMRLIEAVEISIEQRKWVEK